MKTRWMSLALACALLLTLLPLGALATETDYFGLWMCDAEHNPNTGGSVVIYYELDDGTVPPDSGTEWTSSTNQNVPKGTKVTLEAKPAEGYRFKGWYQANIDKTGPEDSHYLSDDFISDDNPYTFTGNPCGEGYSPYICAVFEKDVGLTPVTEITLYPDRPTAGATTDTEEPFVGQSDWTFFFSSVRWADDKGAVLTAPQTFEDGKTYYIAVTLQSYWASDAHCFFVQGGENQTTVKVEGGELIGEPSITNSSGQPSTMDLLLAVKAMVKRPADQIQIWVGNTDGRGVPFSEMGGKVAVKYTPSEPNVWELATKDGTDYRAGEIVQFYAGDEITAYARADEGYRFVGWYDVNIEWGPEAGTKSYQGDVISTARSITYKPGETVFPGRTEPQRYVCAVFEVGEESCRHEHVRTEHKDPTCTEAGYNKMICEDCGEVLSSFEITAIGHDWDEGKITTPATVTEEGVKTFTCTRCGETKTEVIPATGGEPQNPFKDVKAEDYYYDAVIWAVGNEPQITNGTSATTFSPNAACTRGQVVTFLWRANGCPEPKRSDNPFKDVKESDYYYKAVLWAAENGVTTGTSETTFSPNAPCTRAHVVTFLWRAEGEPAPKDAGNPFADVTAGQYYTSAVLWAVSHEPQITNGTSATTFSPNATCTRGQIVTFLYRAMGA